ncbi:MAG: sulfurtransferase [Xenococcaceae cyanobacterium]
MTKTKSFLSLLSARSLAERLEDTQIVVVDCRFSLSQPELGYQQYLTSHIPGAYYLDLNKDLSAPVNKHGGRHPLPNIDVFAEKLTAIGIKQNETLVVAYDDSRFAFAARLWWLLRYLGHQKVALLDGGWQAWLEEGYPVTDEIPSKLSQGFFKPQLRSDWVVDIETVRNLRPNTVLIDSRESERFRGDREPIDPIAGHIPGAINAPWQNVTDDRGYLRTKPEQQQLWQPYQQEREIIVYCGSGVTACVNLLSLELSGFTNTKLYPGGWSDWCSYNLSK